MELFALSRNDIAALVDLDEIIAAVEQAFADFAAGSAVIPPVINLDIAESKGEVHVKSAHIRGYKHYCIKIASGFYENPILGLPSGNGFMALFSARTGELSAVLFDEGYLTDLRTAAAGAVAALCLTHDAPISAGVIGTGVQARLQIESLSKVRTVERLNVWGRDPGRVERYAADMQKILPDTDIRRFATPGEVVRVSDCVVTVTPSREPLVAAKDLHPGLHITAVGSDGPDKQEIDPAVFGSVDRIVVDHLGQCAALGELHHALDAGIVTEQNVHAELGEIVNRNKPGREGRDEITICDLTGVGVQDTAIANWALLKAKHAQCGKTVTF